MSYQFTGKHYYAVKNHLLTGITLKPWLDILWRYGGEMDWQTYWLRVVFLTAMAVMTTALSVLEKLVYGRHWADQQLNEHPVFILGHPRTGTTHLHNLLSLDPRFAYATTFQAGFPSTFLLCERYSWLLAPLLDSTRPMDNMALSFTTPAEDEIATNVLSGGVSPYMPLVLMRSYRRFFKFFTFAEAPQAQLQAWTQAFLLFLKKVTLRHGGCKPLLIKSPVHTARIALLLRLFPKAKFIYMHRHPLQVFQSAAHMADSYYWYCYLQRPSDQDITSFILEQYEVLYEAYMRDRSLIPPGSLIELSFDQLDRDPVGVLGGVYQQWGWAEDFQRLRPRLEGYVGNLGDFKKNDHCRLSPEVEALVRRRWAPSFKTFGYS